MRFTTHGVTPASEVIRLAQSFQLHTELIRLIQAEESGQRDNRLDHRVKCRNCPREQEHPEQVWPRPPPPFASFEWKIAWRYLRARRAEGGVSVMTWISLIGITLAVFALIATLAVRSGFRSEFVGTILGANAHVTVYSSGEIDAQGRVDRTIADYEERAARIAQVPSVQRAAPLVKGQVLITNRDRSSGVEVFGIRPDDLLDLPGIAQAEQAVGDLSEFQTGEDVIAIGSGVARSIGATVGDVVKLTSPKRGKNRLRYFAPRECLSRCLCVLGRTL